MDTSELIQLATLISVLIGLVGIIVSIRAYRRQVSAQFILEYTRRFDDMLMTMPAHMWTLHILGKGEAPAPSEEVTLGVLRCLNLVGQLHYFSRRGYIPPSSWRRTKVTLARILQSPLFRREWKNLAPIFETDRAFSRYVERVQRLPQPGGRGESARA